MHLLKIGSQGENVRALQRRLHTYQPGLAVDGIFGPRTERAVRIAQRKLGLYPPDGVAGPITMAGLARAGGGSAQPHASAQPPVHARPVRAPAAAPLPAPAPSAGPGDPGPLRHAVDPARRRARENPMPPGEASPVAGMRTSREGRRFIISHESQRGVSNRLHHPSAGSGVTIGPGYDMKDRSQQEVRDALVRIDVPVGPATQASQGAGLSGQAASKFVSDNKTVLNLSTDQESALLDHIIGHYEAMVKRAIKIDLHQCEFNALVSYAYNPGGGWRKTTELVNQRQFHEAMLEIKRHVTSRGKTIRSLVVRREAEARVFLYGDYR